MEEQRNCWKCGQDFRLCPLTGKNRTGPRVCPACSQPRPWSAERWRDRALTRRELQIVEAVRQGKINKQIAYELHLEEGTVKAHLHQIYRKLGVSNRTAAAVYATKEMLGGQPTLPPTALAAPLLLSPRQRQIVTLLRQGKRNEEIALELHLSRGSVREYLSRLYKKVNADGRTQLAVRATVQHWAPVNSEQLEAVALQPKQPPEMASGPIHSQP